MGGGLSAPKGCEIPFEPRNPGLLFFRGVESTFQLGHPSFERGPFFGQLLFFRGDAGSQPGILDHGRVLIMRHLAH